MPNLNETEVVITWSPEDIQSIRPDLSLEQCKKWLSIHAQRLRDEQVKDGLNSIESLLSDH